MRYVLPAFALLVFLSAPALATGQDDHNSHSLPAADEPAIEIITTPAAPAASGGPTNLLPAVVETVPMDLHAGQGATRTTTTPAPSHSSHNMGALNPDSLPQAATDRRGGAELTSEVIEGVRVFRLTADEIAWPITDDTRVYAYAYNGQVPGPMIRVKAGEKIRIAFTNQLAEPSTIHWHGVDVPVEMDGVPGISQEPVPAGGTFFYDFTVPNSPGTFFYHTHVMADKQQALGLSGAFIIDPATPPKARAWDSEHTFVLSEWTITEGGNVPSMPMEGMMPNYFTINGKSWPDTQKLTAKVGEKVLLRFINAGSFSHPIHLHGAPFKVIATDGHAVPAGAVLTKDTIEIAPGERYDLLWTPTRAGTWLIHCHINHHAMNNGQEVDGMGGMAVAIEVGAQ